MQDQTYPASAEVDKLSTGGENTSTGSDINPDIGILQRLLHLASPEMTSYRDQDVVFVCVDCEAYEHDQSMITEIGVSVLDTKRIKQTNTGGDAFSLLSNIESAHYRIREYGHLKNKRFVKGNPDGFAFGNSTWVDKADAKMVLNRLFSDPGNISQASKLDEASSDAARNVVLVGHGLKNETGYLKVLGFALNDVRNVSRRMDTATIIGGKKGMIGLKGLLQMLEINVRKERLHNAGNDAYYTLQALLTVGLREHASPGSMNTLYQEQRGARLAQRAEMKAQRKGARAAQKDKARTDSQKDKTTAGASSSDGPSMNGLKAKLTESKEQKLRQQKRKRPDAETPTYTRVLKE